MNVVDAINARACLLSLGVRADRRCCSQPAGVFTHVADLIAARRSRARGKEALRAAQAARDDAKKTKEQRVGVGSPVRVLWCGRMR